MGLSSKKHKDPVCGMMVTEDDAADREAHKGHTDYFCSTQCATKFRASPMQYA